MATTIATATHRVGTYPGQWWFCVPEDAFFFKKNPEWVVPRAHFNKRFFLWTDPEGEAGDPASTIISTFGSQVEGRTWDKNEIAGVVTRNGKRVVNIPVSKLAA